MNISSPFLATVLLAFMLSGCAVKEIELPAGVSPLEATWLYGRHSVPDRYTRDGRHITIQQAPGMPLWTDIAQHKLKPGVSVPAVLYMHGCKGWSRQDDISRALMLEQGYAVFMPDSFMRPGRKQCWRHGKLRMRIDLRHEEVAHALARLREQPWVDPNRILLMGFSEGGNTTDNWPRSGFQAHIVLGSACTLNDGRPAVPDNIPILAIVGSQDHYRPGLSCDIQRSVGGSKSVVLPGVGHSVIQLPEAQAELQQFLGSCCN